MSQRDPSPTPDRQLNRRGLLARFEIDRAVLYVLASRFWQLVAGPVTILLIAAYFSKETQGFFYTFGSLTALQSFVELGLHMVLLNLFGHAWSGLRWQDGSLAGEEQTLARFRGLDEFSRRWYGVAALLFAIGVGTAGELFFAASGETDVAWRPPWWTLVGLTALSLRLMPTVTLLEGCGHVTIVNRFRLAQAIAGNLVVWPLIVGGAGLWTCVAAAAVKLTGEILLTRIPFGAFLACVRRRGKPREIDWREDVWPLQWRAGLQSVFLYFSSAVFVPLIFHYRGAEEAGRLGMTWTVLSALQSAAFGWVQTRVPRLARLAAEEDRAGFDAVWRRVTGSSLAALFVGAAGFVAAVAMLGSLAWSSLIGERGAVLAGRLAERMLSAWELAPFAAGICVWHFFACETVYLRAHRIDPLVRINVVGNLLIGVAAWALANRYGSFGAGVGYLLVVTLVLAPGTHLIWRGFREERQR